MYFFHASRFLQAYFWWGALKIPGSGKSTLVGALMLTAGAISERELMKRRKALDFQTIIKRDTPGLGGSCLGFCSNPEVFCVFFVVIDMNNGIFFECDWWVEYPTRNWGSYDHQSLCFTPYCKCTHFTEAAGVWNEVATINPMKIPFFCHNDWSFSGSFWHCHQLGTTTSHGCWTK